ncbi:LysR family transcriptional regulator [Hoeflea prorocentri]|uniref:LysR family transcriptional regulator n=1 Tax=Hoeflea prorocentri TaxID=1922333 RepID=A0A9X3ZG80_9HYPH|nr:LysR family transcriptional regulator [Hoeflea prorocentri]MCY6379470.1 LysR family transcriptional regulator [Hoeflea prorocentri]MDA5397270.1 LysR family transcriptional regulator [Hoeflea prorocentri]
MSLRFRQLQAFHAIVEIGTVTGAAEQLGISQPGISNLLAQLERQTRLKLFERSKGRLVPTPEAGVLYQEVDTVVRGLDHVGQAVLDLQNKQAGQLQVASPHALSFGLMPKLIARFAQERPDMSISFQSQYSTKIQEWVMSGLFEIGVCEMPLTYDAFDARIIHVETLLAIPQDSPLARHDVLTPQLLENEPFIVMGPDHLTHRRTREAFSNAGVAWRTRVHTHLFKNVLSFVQEGMGVGIIDPFSLNFDFEGGFVTRPFQPTVLMDFAVITSKARPLSALGKQFHETLLAELQTYAASARG